MPKRPRSFGPCAIGIGLLELAHSFDSCGARAKARRAAATNALILRFVLHAGRALDAGGDIDAARAASARSPPRRCRGRARRTAATGVRGAKSRARRPVERHGRCRPAAPRPWAAWRRSAENRRRPRKRSAAAKSARAATPIAFIVGRAQSSPIRFTRAGVSRPCNCMRSGDSASTMRFERVVVGVDAERDDLGAAPRLRARARARSPSRHGAGSSGKTRIRPCPRRRRARRPASRASRGRRF